MQVMIHRFWIKPGSWPEFERLSREAVWPPMFEMGARVIGLFLADEPDPRPQLTQPTDMAWLIIAYVDNAHREATRTNSPTFAGSAELHDQLAAARAERSKLVLHTERRFASWDGKGFIYPQLPVCAC